MTTQTRWQISGDYFENCNCNVVCPCAISPNRPMTSMPTEGACEVAFAFHITTGSFSNVSLDGLNVAMIARTPGPMAEGNWSVALYIDERANDQQLQALQAIFGGSAGGPVGALAPLISTVLGAKTVPIPSMDPNNEIWALNAHPFASKLALAVGDQNSTWTDYGMSWDNSGKNGHYASINWSNA
jgi:hypothetical protein